MRRWKWLWLVTVAGSILLGLQCGEDTGPGPELPKLVLNVDSASLEVSSLQQFEATYDGDTPEVIWDVDGTVGGDPWKGMITDGGLYIAPDMVPQGGTVRVRARAVEDTTYQASATVRITADGEPVYVTVAPDTATVLIGDSLQFTGEVVGCSSEDIAWSVAAINGQPLDIGSVRSNGTYVAPVTAASSITLMVKAVSADCSDKIGVARVAIPAQARAFDVELEDFTDAYEIGFPYITTIPCGAASGGKSVVGLNLADEYIDVPMRVPGNGAYFATVSYAARTDDSIQVRVSVDDCGYGLQQEDFLLDQGTGTG
jgi:hypothetical protein